MEYYFPFASSLVGDCLVAFLKIYAKWKSKNHILRMKVTEVLTAVEKKATESLEGLNYLVVRQSLKSEDHL